MVWAFPSEAAAHTAFAGDKARTVKQGGHAVSIGAIGQHSALFRWARDASGEPCTYAFSSQNGPAWLNAYFQFMGGGGAGCTPWQSPNAYISEAAGGFWADASSAP